MREIKFRAWYGGAGYGDIKPHIPHMLYDERPGDCLVWVNQGQDIRSVMQYTGLKDKNGKEIYEGDLLTVSPYQDEEHTVKVYHQYSASIIDTPFSSEHEWTTLGYYVLHFGEHTIEIIGSIYTHPELLEATK